MAKPAEIHHIAVTSRRLKVIIYGEPGSGKTVLACTSPDALILDADDGTESGALQGSDADVWKIDDYGDLTEAYEYLRHDKHGYKWVWIDSGSIFQEKGLDQIMVDLVADRPYRDPDVPDKGEYGKNMRRFAKMVRLFKGLPMHFGMTAHPMRVEDEDGKVTYMPYIQGRQMPEKFCAYMNIVGYLAKERHKVEGSKEREVRRVLYTESRGKYYAKDRFDAFENGRLINPTVPTMVATIRARLLEHRKEQG